jgi:hypothetical protein
MGDYDQEKYSWLQVRMTNEEKLELVELAEKYGVSLSAMVRMMTTYFLEKEPVISMKFGPKADAPALEAAIAQ